MFGSAFIKSLTSLLLILSCVWPLQLHAERSAPALAIIDFYPFGYALPDGGPEGMVFDLSAAVEELSGITIDERLVSVPRALRSASIAQNDLLFSYRDEVMVPNVTWLGNVGCLVPLVVPHRNSGIKTLADLHGKRVGYVGLGYFDVRMSKRWDLVPVVLNNNFIMLKMLARHRVDAIVLNNAVLNAFLSRPDVLAELPEDWPQLLSNPIPLAMYETHLSMANDSPFQDLIPRLKQAIIHGREKGIFQEIFRKYGSEQGGHCYSPEELKQEQWLRR